jgi:hypothetical protein
MKTITTKEDKKLSKAFEYPSCFYARDIRLEQGKSITLPFPHHEPCRLEPVYNTEGEYIGNEAIGKHLYLEVDLTGNKEQILKDVGYLIDMYRDFMGDKPESRNRPLSLNIWFIYDWIEHFGCNLYQVAKELSIEFNTVKRAYQAAKKVMTLLDNEVSDTYCLIFYSKKLKIMSNLVRTEYEILPREKWPKTAY